MPPHEHDTEHADPGNRFAQKECTGKHRHKRNRIDIQIGCQSAKPIEGTIPEQVTQSTADQSEIEQAKEIAEGKQTQNRKGFFLCQKERSGREDPVEHQLARYKGAVIALQNGFCKKAVKSPEQSGHQSKRVPNGVQLQDKHTVEHHQKHTEKGKKDTDQLASG